MSREGGSLRVVLLILTWYATSSVSNSLQKTVLKSLPLPITLSIAQLVMSSLTSFLPTLFLSSPPKKEGGPAPSNLQFLRDLSGTLWAQLLCISVCVLGSMICHRLSLLFSAVSFTHTVKATSPVFSVMIAKTWLHEDFSLRTYATLVPTVFGVGLACFTESGFSLMGFVTALLSCFFMSVQQVLTKAFMQKKMLSKTQQMFCQNVLATGVMLPFWLFLEFGEFVTFCQENSDSFHVLLQLFVTTICLFVQQSVSLSTLDEMSPVSYSIVNTFKRVVVIAFAVVYFQKPITPLNGVGILISTAGVYSYQHSCVKPKLDKVHKKDFGV